MEGFSSLFEQRVEVFDVAVSPEGSGDPSTGARRKGRDINSNGGHRDLPSMEHAVQVFDVIIAFF